MFRALFGVPHLFARELLMNSPHLRRWPSSVHTPVIKEVGQFFCSVFG